MSKTRIISPRNRRKNKEKSKVCPGKYSDTRQGKKNKKNRKLYEAETGKAVAGNLANLGISMGSKAVNSVLEKK